jgi:serine/threonine-protein phosphatase 2B regulatory subunit
MRELERIYDEFRRVARHRGDYDAKVDIREFQEIMAKLTNNNALIREIFNAIDTDKSGYIDFKNFIVGLSVLRHGTREQKLWLAFRAYDTMGLETLDRVRYI